MSQTEEEALSVDASVTNVCVRDGPYAPDFFEASAENLDILKEDTVILIVGAGGLGCELLKDAAYSGFTDIHVIDLDTIDISNLNRQFLFRKGDEGKDKAECAAKKIMEKNPDCKVTFYKRPIQEFERDWYSQFNVIIAGLDNQAAREWLNNTVLDLVRYNEDGSVDEDTVIPMIDGGTEGLAGQARVFLPRKNSCFTCQKASEVARLDLHMCTPAVNPRIPEHCVQYALIFLWPLLQSIDPKSATNFQLWEGKSDENPSPVKLDKDDPVHMTWLFNRALEWAEKHNIKGVTYSLCMQVVKNIIPAVACTNAIMAAACVNEAFKWVTQTSPIMDSFFSYNGNSALGTYSRTFRYMRNPQCEACQVPQMVSVPTTTSLGELLLRVQNDRKDGQDNARKAAKVVFRGDQKVYSVVTSDASVLTQPISDFLKADEETGGYQRDIWRIQDADGDVTQVHITST